MADHRSVASERWRILKKAILAASRESRDGPELSQQDLQASVRSFSSFGLLSVNHVAAEKHPQFSWKKYTYRDDRPSKIEQSQSRDADNESKSKDRKIRGDLEFSAIIRHLPESTSFEAMLGFNNTGNVCVWPSEEVLAYYCLKNREQFRGKSICELGAGMTGMAGILLSLTHLPSRVKLTDGNPVSVKNISLIIEENQKELGETSVSADVLVWDQEFLDSDYQKYDTVICADCLFFVELHSCLCQVIHKLLLPGGTALVFSPRRTGTLDQFVDAAKGLFSIKEIDNYDDVIWSKHCISNSDKRYKPDLHYPILLTLEPLPS